MGERLCRVGDRWGFGGRELHCGDCFQVLDPCENKWITVRIELRGRDEWYLWGLPGYLQDRHLENFLARA